MFLSVGCRKMNTYGCFIVIIWINLILIKESQTETSNCEEKTTCTQCIHTKGCAWCSKVDDEYYTATSLVSKCHLSEQILQICDKKYIENPKKTMKITANQPMRNGANGNTVQIRPQQLILNLKPEEEFTVEIEFKKAENYPVDLYYLMDFSSSMSKHKNNLSKLGDKLAETMKNLTADFQLGFGSFVDKVVLPYTSTLPSQRKLLEGFAQTVRDGIVLGIKNLNNEDIANDILYQDLYQMQRQQDSAPFHSIYVNLLRPCLKCSPPYSFKNHMSLTRQTTRFSVEVAKAQLSGNIDTPEGVLDALMQTIVCAKQLHWRDRARHIIILSTDAPFHLAGDGKLGGIVEPNDGRCYINEKGVYTHSLVFDYPSVSQINHKALDNNMNIIFAVVNKVKKEYLSLSKEIRGSSLGLLDAGGNIAELIKAQYEKITSTIRLTDNAKVPVHIAYSALCHPDGSWKNSNECNDIKGGSVAFFKAHITVSDCLDKRYANQKITIKPVGMNETLTVHLETICDCDCSASNHPANEMKSKFCSYSGDLICGLCVCDETKIGQKCECAKSNNDIVNASDITPCISNNLTNEICSGHGECRCGVCQCYPRQTPKEERTGRFCECDNYSCKRSNGLLCSGHGICKCGKCSCESEWSGETCDCPVDNLPCRMENEEVCSGKGKCICGICHCQDKTNVDEHRYAGKYCQICTTCMQQQCHLHNDCVECLSFESGPLATDRCKNCTKLFQHHLIEKIENVEKNYSGVSCVSADHSGCTFKYFYYYKGGGQLVVWAEAKTICPKKVNLYAVVGGTIGSTILTGLLSLILWKVFVEIHDKREYEKFERERHLARWGKGENPLFKTATTSYENPTYVVDTC